MFLKVLLLIVLIVTAIIIYKLLKTSKIKVGGNEQVDLSMSDLSMSDLSMSDLSMSDIKDLVSKIDNKYELINYDEKRKLKKYADFISFPYKKFFIKPDGIFKKLCAYKAAKIVPYEYNSKFHNYFTSEESKKNKLDVKFDNKYLAVDVMDSYSVDLLTDLYQEEERIKCNVVGRQSPLEYWITHIDDLCKEAMQIKDDRTLSEKLRELIYEKCQECTLFKVTYAKFMYEKFNATKILDFSAGWGDRLLAAMAAKKVKKYLAYDPNINLKPGHDAMIADYNKNKKMTIVYEPFETAVLNETFDLVFTSPPYFNLEIYKSNNQSIDSFKTYSDWKNGFLFVALKKAWDVLDVHGHLIIHIANIKIYNGDKFEYANIIEDMNNYIFKFKGAQFKGSLGIIGRPKGIEKVRPAWVWQKI
jgi:hypothetical protein